MGVHGTACHHQRGSAGLLQPELFCWLNICIDACSTTHTNTCMGERGACVLCASILSVPAVTAPLRLPVAVHCQVWDLCEITWRF